MPCMAAGVPGSIARGAVEIVKEAVAEGKPVAAQHGAVAILGEADVLGGKKYAYRFDGFQEGYYMGHGVIQDVTIITSGTCPYEAKRRGQKDGTPELTSKLIQILK